MPTPFTHLALSRQMLTDRSIPDTMRADLLAARGAFYLGQIAADGHALEQPPVKREKTHFYTYTHMPNEKLWHLMMNENASLRSLTDPAARAFVAGYVAHLSVDEYWARHMAAPNFGASSWGDQRFRFLMLNVLLIHMDERDYDRISHPPEARADMAEQLYAANPDHWLPFLSDHALCEWGAVIHRQIKPGGLSETLQILAPRIMNMSALKLRAILDSESRMQRDLWRHVPRAEVQAVEAGMYAFARDEMIAYWTA